jgi:ribonuclease HII
MQGQGPLIDFAKESDTFSFERSLYAKGVLRVAGCDEVGRGPLAGPVVAAAVILPQNCRYDQFVDSKLLTHKQRLSLEEILLALPVAFGIGIVSEQEIDRINILQASLFAMRMAVQNLPGPQPDFLLVDGKFRVPMTIDQQPLIKGESKSASIAAASIIAKVTRDRLMDDLHDQYPVYNFLQNKGYPTREHRKALAGFGPCPVHRKTFKGVKEHVL